MDNEIELISDGDGLAVIGERTAVERFLDATGLSKVESQSLGLAVVAGASAAQAGAEVAASSGRWLKLTAESAEKLKKVPLTPTDTPGVSHAMLGQRGSIKSWLQVETGGAKLLSNPALLSGAAGVMAQMANRRPSSSTATGRNRSVHRSSPPSPTPKVLVGGGFLTT